MPSHRKAAGTGACKRLAALLGLLAASAAGLSPVGASSEETGLHRGLPTIAEKTQGLARDSGLLDVYVDRREGRIFLALPPEASSAGGFELIYGEGIRAGLGSNPVGLDRSRLGSTRHVRFRRAGGRIFLEELNTRYRALTGSAAERRAVRDSFATSVLWSGEVAAEEPDGRLLVDLSPFLTSDVFGFAGTLKATAQGAFQLDEERSAVELDRILVFPENVEVDATLTFAGPEPGEHVRDTAPDPRAVTVVQHHSFVRLPDPGYRPRRFDPRAGSFAVTFLDYAAALDSPLEKKWIVRHRLEKVDPGAPRSRVKEPIVYYVDSGVPEPVRSALVEGASWWARAFDEAGFIDAFRVEMLPEGVHPLDARYNAIHWVHRSTRGWSYGGGMVDPRTGEMIKGNVLLGSLRVRQDRLLFEGLAGTARTGSGGPGDPVELALARLRQLSAHEVGHTLGFTHNFAASTYGRASVMDYPAPLVDIREDGSLDFSRAYAVGAGRWDVQSVRYAYGEPAPGEDEEGYLSRIIAEGIDKGLLFITDHDARPGGAAHPLGNLWDNGDDPVAELLKILRVRRIALEAFAKDRIREGRPLALLREVFLPVYFHHRYQLAAAAKVVGGMDYGYAVRGDGQPPVRPLDPERQRAALEAILKVLDPAALDIPESALEILLPRPFGYPATRELHQGRTDPAFDTMGVARTAARMAADALLQPQRAARLVDFHRREPGQPGLKWLLESLVRQAFETPAAGGDRLAGLSWVIRGEVVGSMIRLSSHGEVTPEVRALVDRSLSRLAAMLEAGPPDPRGASLAAKISRFLQRDLEDPPPEPSTPEPPPGSPIGSFPGPAGCSLEDPWST